MKTEQTFRVRLLTLLGCLSVLSGVAGAEGIIFSLPMEAVPGAETIGYPADRYASDAHGTVRSSPLAFALVGTGLFLFEIGSIADTIGFEYRQKSAALWDAYTRSGAADEGLLSDYSVSFTGYRAFGVSSYLLWGAGAAAVSSSLFLFSPQDIGLSRWGRVVFSTGLLLSLTGNIFSSIASSQGSRNTRLWEAYVEQGGDDSSRYEEYKDGYSLYRAARVAGYTLWGLGGAGLIGAFLIPGDREPLAPTLRDKLLLAAGMVLLTAGNIFHSCSLNALAEAEQRWDEYLNAGAAQESLLPPYEMAYDRYTFNRFLAYGFWIGGGVLVLTSLFLPSQGSAAHGPVVQPVSMGLVPLDRGIRFAIRIGL